MYWSQCDNCEAYCLCCVEMDSRLQAGRQYPATEVNSAWSSRVGRHYESLSQGTTHPNVCKFHTHVNCDSGLVLIWQQCSASCTSSFMDDLMFDAVGHVLKVTHQGACTQGDSPGGIYSRWLTRGWSLISTTASLVLLSYLVFHFKHFIFCTQYCWSNCICCHALVTCIYIRNCVCIAVFCGTV